MHVLIAPERGLIRGPAIFLAGSIEQGTAEDWQARVIEELCDLEVTVLNPRRLTWDASLPQDISNDVFADQVFWELDHLQVANVVLMYLQPETKSPISLLELGLLAGLGTRTMVVCPPGFWRRGNVQVMCHRFKNIELYDDLESAVEVLRKRYA